MILSMIKRDFRDKRKLCVYHNDLVPGRKTLFFIHRLRGSAKNWQAQFRRFSQGYNIVAYDLMGHGQSASPKKTSDYTITESLADAYSIIRYFELENITIVACGYGVLIGLLLSERYANLVNKQLLINPVIYQQKNTCLGICSHHWHGYFSGSYLAKLDSLVITIFISLNYLYSNHIIEHLEICLS